MAKLAEARELFKQNRFEEALGLFQFIAHEIKHSLEERIESFEAMLVIYSSWDAKKELLSTQREFLAFLVENKNYTAAQEIAETIVKNEKQIILHDVYCYWLCLAQNGEIDKAEKLSVCYLEELYKRKNFERGLAFVNELEQRLSFVELALYYRVQFLILKEDYETLSKVLIQNKTLLTSDTKLEKNEYLKKCAKCALRIYPKEMYPQISQTLLEVGFALLTKSSKATVQYQKNFIYTFFDLLLVRKFDTELFKLLLDYARYFQRTDLAAGLIAVINLQPELLRGQKKTSKVLEEVKMERANWPEPIKANEVFDMAEDLFNNPAIPDVIENKSKAKNKKEAQNKKNKEVGAGEPHWVLKEMLMPIKEERDDKVMLTSFRKYLTYLDKEYIRENFRDLAVSLFTFEAWDLALEFLDNTREFLDAENDWDKKISLEYLYIIACEKLGRDYQALIAIENVIQFFPIIEEEIILFNYLKGDICKRLGKKDDALRAFRLVEKQDSHYRLVQQRIRELA